MNWVPLVQSVTARRRCGLVRLLISVLLLTRSICIDICTNNPNLTNANAGSVCPGVCSANFLEFNGGGVACYTDPNIGLTCPGNGCVCSCDRIRQQANNNNAAEGAGGGGAEAGVPAMAPAPAPAPIPAPVPAPTPWVAPIGGQPGGVQGGRGGGGGGGGGQQNNNRGGRRRCGCKKKGGGGGGGGGQQRYDYQPSGGPRQNYGGYNYDNNMRSNDFIGARSQDPAYVRDDVNNLNRFLDGLDEAALAPNRGSTGAVQSPLIPSSQSNDLRSGKPQTPAKALSSQVLSGQSSSNNPIATPDGRARPPNAAMDDASKFATNDIYGVLDFDTPSSNWFSENIRQLQQPHFARNPPILQQRSSQPTNNLMTDPRVPAVVQQQQPMQPHAQQVAKSEPTTGNFADYLAKILDQFRR